MTVFIDNKISSKGHQTRGFFLGINSSAATQTEPRVTDIDRLPLTVPDPPRVTKPPPTVPPLPDTQYNRVHTPGTAGNYQQEQPYEVN